MENITDRLTMFMQLVGTETNAQVSSAFVHVATASAARSYRLLACLLACLLAGILRLLVGDLAYGIVRASNTEGGYRNESAMH